MRPVSNSKRSHRHNHHHHHHSKDKQQFLRADDEARAMCIDPNPSPHHSHHRRQVEEMRSELSQALDDIRYIAAHCAHESIIESIRDEWKFIATVIDRLQFLIFLAVTFFGSLALLYQVSDRRFPSFDHTVPRRCLGPAHIPRGSERCPEARAIFQSEHDRARTHTCCSNVECRWETKKHGCVQNKSSLLILYNLTRWLSCPPQLMYENH